MSVNKMVELYVSYGLDETTWGMLYQMKCHGLIKSENWEKFYEKCRDWRLTFDGNGVEDGDGNIIYSRDRYGFLTKL